MPSIDLDDFSDDDLASELEERGYSVIHENDHEADENPFTKEELDFLRKTIDDMKYDVGSIEWGIREKLSNL